MNNNFPRGTPIHSFPVDLNRDEYIKFNQVISTVTGNRKLKNSDLFFLISIIVSITIILSDILVDGSINYYYIFLVIILLISNVLFSKIINPNLVKIKARQRYDASILKGHNYFGQVLLYNDHIEKINDSYETMIFFKDNVNYIETKDMIIIFPPGHPSIVLPSRCLVYSDIAAIKPVLLNIIPISRQYVLEEFVPTATAHMEIPDIPIKDDVWDNDTSYRITVAYTKDELNINFKELLLIGLGKRIPNYSFSAILVGILTYVFADDILLGIAVFCIVLIGSTLKHILDSKIQSNNIYKKTSEENEFIIFEFGPKGVILKSTWQKDEAMGFTWSAISRITQDDLAVRIFTTSTVLYIPRRVISDFYKLENIVDLYFSKTKP